MLVAASLSLRGARGRIMQLHHNAVSVEVVEYEAVAHAHLLVHKPCDAWAHFKAVIVVDNQPTRYDSVPNPGDDVPGGIVDIDIDVAESKPFVFWDQVRRRIRENPSDDPVIPQPQRRGF